MTDLNLPVQGLPAIPQIPQRKFPLSLILLLLFTIPPIAFIFTWMDSTYHKSLRVYLFLFGALFLVQAFAARFTPKTTSNPNSLDGSLLLFAVLLGIFQILYAFFYRESYKSRVTVASLTLMLASTLLIYITIRQIFQMGQSLVPATNLEGIY